MVCTRRSPRLMIAARMESGELRQAKQGEASHPQTLRGDGVFVVGDQLSLTSSNFTRSGGRFSSSSRRRKNCREWKAWFSDPFHTLRIVALTDVFIASRFSRMVPVLRSDPGKCTRRKLSFRFKSDSDVPRKK